MRIIACSASLRVLERCIEIKHKESKGQVVLDDSNAAANVGVELFALVRGNGDFERIGKSMYSRFLEINGPVDCFADSINGYNSAVIVVT